MQQWNTIIINSCFSLEDLGQCAALAENVHVRCEALWRVHLSVALFLFPKTTVLKKFLDRVFFVDRFDQSCVAVGVEHSLENVTLKRKHD